MNKAKKSGVLRVIVFVRALQKGRVKTRLMGHLGADIVLELYQRFVEDVLETAGKTGIPVVVGFYPANQEQAVRTWLGGRYLFMPQTGTDLGERMADAFVKVFEQGAEKAVLIGTDFPDLPGKILTNSFDLLDKNDAVLGPATDGGYYLIGFKKGHMVKKAFEGIEWGQNNVFSQTLQILSSHLKSVGLVDAWRDIDYLEDLTEYYIQAKQSQVKCNTLDYLDSIDFGSNT